MLRNHSYDEDKISFYTVDEHAKKASNKYSSTYDSLIAYLRKPIVNDKNSELQLARAIIVWMCHVQSTDLSRADHTSPRALISQMKERCVENSRVFKVLCGYADIQCEVIQGRAKAIRYQAGDEDSDYIRRHTWNAFKAGDRWHLLHPQWCIHAYVGYVHGGDYVMEVDGKHEIRQNVQRDGVSMYKMNAFWFCTNPEIFVQRCLPDDPKWQCLPKDRIVKSVAEYLAFPDLRQGYYAFNLQYIGHKSCVLQVNNGKCTINLLSERNMGKELQFSYELLAAKIENLPTENLPLLVFFVPNQPPDTFTFDINLPSAGEYRLKIRVGLNGQKPHLMGCCEFKIKCTAGDPNCRKLPIDTGIQGWGFGPDAEAVGLKRASNMGAKIPVQPGTSKDLVTFKVDADEMDARIYSASIYKSSDSLSVTEKPLVKFDKGKRKLSVQAKNTTDLQQAALVISCRDKDQPASSSKPVANYILTSVDSEDKAMKDELEKKQKMARHQEKLTKRLESTRLLEEKKSRFLYAIADNEYCYD